MKISELIEALENLEATYGDLPVTVRHDMADWIFNTNVTVKVEDAKQGQPTLGGAKNYVMPVPFGRGYAEDAQKVLDTLPTLKVLVLA